MESIILLEIPNKTFHRYSTKDTKMRALRMDTMNSKYETSRHSEEFNHIFTQRIHMNSIKDTTKKTIT